MRKAPKKKLVPKTLQKVWKSIFKEMGKQAWLRKVEEEKKKVKR
jgi:hypothetical protein